VVTETPGISDPHCKFQHHYNIVLQLKGQQLYCGSLSFKLFQSGAYLGARVVKTPRAYLKGAHEADLQPHHENR
jgi:hypothetical protein